MVNITEYVTGQYKVNNWIINAAVHVRYVDGDNVGIYDNGLRQYIIKPTVFSDWNDPSGSPYASLDALISDLNSFFFDIVLPFPEVNTFADLPTASTNTGSTFHVLNATGTWILGTRRQAGFYRSNGTNWILRNDISSLLVDSEFNIRDDADNSKGIRFVLDALTTGILRAITWPDRDITVAGTDEIIVDGADKDRSWDGMAYDKLDIIVADANPDVSVSVQAEGGGDPSFFIAGARYTLSTPATVNLNLGTVANPVTNFIYVTTSGLQVSTGLPTGEFAWVGKLSIADRASFLADGLFVFQRFTESFLNNGRGLFSHEREKIRLLGALYISGVNQTVAITTNAGSADNVHLELTSGLIHQLHRQTWPAFTVGPYYYGNGPNVNERINDLNEILTDVNGGSLVDKYFNLIFWGAVASDTAESKIFVNLPSAAYDSQSQAIADSSNTSDYSVPEEFRSVGFLISRVTLRQESSANGTWTEEQTLSLLGNPTGIRSGGTSAPAVSSEFIDSVFKIINAVDGSKAMVFNLVNVGTGQQRTIFMPDSDVNLAAIAVNSAKVSADGSVTTHNNVSSAGSGEIITGQERTDINASVGVHSDVDPAGVTLLDNTVLRYDSANTEFIACLHQIVRSSALVINNTATLQDKINVNIDVQRLVPHKITISYHWSLNDGAQDLVSEASFGGQDLMTALTDNSEIHRQEPKDTGGADPDGRGTNQRLPFHRTFYVTPLSVGANALILQFAGSAGGDLASMWEASIEVEELISVTGS